MNNIIPSSFNFLRSVLKINIKLHRHASNKNIILDSGNRCLEIFNGAKFHYVWLRDHCRCNDCYNHVTCQRVHDVMRIPLDIQPRSCSMDENHLHLTWEDNHVSSFSLSWLEANTHEAFLQRRKQQSALWDSSVMAGNDVTSRADYNQFIHVEECVSSLMKSLIKYGVAFVDKVPPNLKTTEEVVERVAAVQQTFFGRMWDFSDTMDHSDTAYTKEALGAHTDNTYFTEAAGLQVFHCLEYSGSGGDTLLVDGFKAADTLRQQHSDVYNRLCVTHVEAEYLEPGQHHSCIDPIIKVDPVTGQVFQIRFNLYDRAPLTSIPQSQILQHYKDLTTFASIIQQPSMEWWVQLRPGTVIFIDNFRVLHGRAAYEGHRKMGGCYVGRSDFLSKARVLNLTH